MSIKMQNQINSLTDAVSKTLLRVVELEQRIEKLEAAKPTRKPRTKQDG